MNLDGLQPVPICPHLAALSIHPNFVRILSTLILYVRLLLADGYAECGRPLANVVIAYNSMVLSALLERYQAAGNSKALERLRRMSPVAWRHIHFLGHYLFKDQQHPIDLAALLAGVELV